MGKYDELAKIARKYSMGSRNLLNEIAVADKTDITGDAALKRKGLSRNSPGVAYKATTPGPALVAGGVLGAALAVPGVSQLALTAASGMLGDRIARDVAGDDRVDQFYDEYAMPLMAAAPALQPALQASANYASAVRNMLGAKIATGAQGTANPKYLKDVEHNIKIRTTPAGKAGPLSTASDDAARLGFTLDDLTELYGGNRDRALASMNMLKRGEQLNNLTSRPQAMRAGMDNATALWMSNPHNNATMSDKKALLQELRGINPSPFIKPEYRTDPTLRLRATTVPMADYAGLYTNKRDHVAAIINRKPRLKTLYPGKIEIASDITNPNDVASTVTHEMTHALQDYSTARARALYGTTVEKAWRGFGEGGKNAFDTGVNMERATWKKPWSNIELGASMYELKADALRNGLHPHYLDDLIKTKMINNAGLGYIDDYLKGILRNHDKETGRIIKWSDGETPAYKLDKLLKMWEFSLANEGYGVRYS